MQFSSPMSGEGESTSVDWMAFGSGRGYRNLYQLDRDDALAADIEDLRRWARRGGELTAVGPVA